MPTTKVRGKPARRRTPSPKSTRKTRLPRGRSRNRSRSTRRQRSRTRSLSPNFKVPNLKTYLKLAKQGDPVTLNVMKAFRGNRKQRGGNLMDGIKNVFSGKFNNQKLLGNASVSTASEAMGSNSPEGGLEGGRRRRRFSRRFSRRLSRRRNTNRKGGRRRMKGGAGSTHSGYSLGGELPGGLSALANPSSPVGYNDCKINTYNHFTGESS
tara:strand:+ start:116 stop:745 length:630 start_codon:yes stop_codon:yes gene_type:complete